MVPVGGPKSVFDIIHLLKVCFPEGSASFRCHPPVGRCDLLTSLHLLVYQIPSSLVYRASMYPDPLGLAPCGLQQQQQQNQRQQWQAPASLSVFPAARPQNPAIPFSPVCHFPCPSHSDLRFGLRSKCTVPCKPTTPSLQSVRGQL